MPTALGPVPLPGLGEAAGAFAHGLGDAADLPLPFGILLWGTGAAVLGASALAGRRDRAPAAAPAPRRGLPLPAWVTRAADHRVTRATAQAVMLALLTLTVTLAVAGPDRSAVNPAPRLVYAVFWGGLVPLSLLLGPVWRGANPLRLLAAGLGRLMGDPQDLGARPVPPGAGVWPAAALLAVFVWGELALPSEPRPTALVLALLVGVTLGGTGRYGRAWLAHADPFEAYAGALGTNAPVGRDGAGRVGLRGPRAALARLPAPPGLGAVVAVLVGADLFDGVVETLTWQNARVGQGPVARVALDTGGLAVCVLVAALLVWFATRNAPELVPALLPVVAAYAVAHYTPVLLVETQTVMAQLSDPLGRGWDLLGRAGAGASYEMLPGALIALAIVAALVAGHAAAVVVAQDRVAAPGGRGAEAARQLPLRLVLVVSALASVALRFSG